MLERERGRPPSTKALGRLGYWDFTMVDRFLGFEGEITALHLSVLRVRLLAEAKESTAVICCLQSARLVERV